MATYQKGDIVDGYEFLGGDHTDKTRWHDWGRGARALPDGSVVRDGPKGGLQWLRKAEGGQGGEPLREFEINAAGRATLMDEGITEYERAKRDGYNPTSLKNRIARAVEDGPIPGGNFIADVVRDNPSERARAAELQFTDGALRTTSGANAPEPEVRRASRAYFRQPGESEGVERNKQLIRDRFRTTSVKAAGRAYVPRTAGQSIDSPVTLTEENRANIGEGAFFRAGDGKVYRQQKGAGFKGQSSAAANAPRKAADPFPGIRDGQFVEQGGVRYQRKGSQMVEVR